MVRLPLNCAKDKEKLVRERKEFMNWFRGLGHRSEMSLLKVSWEAWKHRAGVKVEPQDCWPAPVQRTSHPQPVEARHLTNFVVHDDKGVVEIVRSNQPICLVPLEDIRDFCDERWPQDDGA